MKTENSIHASNILAPVLPPDWGGIQLDSPPVVILGERRWNKRLDARRLTVHEDAYDALREAPIRTMNLLQEMAAVPYSAAAHPELGEEYLWISAMPKSAAEDGISDLARIAEHPSELPVLTADEFKDLSYSFYGVTFQVAGRTVTFVRKTNPRLAIDRGARYFKFRDSLKKVAQPDLVLDSEFDAVLIDGSIAVLRQSAVSVLLSDVGFSVQHVEDHIKELLSEASAGMPLGGASALILKEVAQRKVSVARRLPEVIARVREFKITTKQVEDALQSHGYDATEFRGDDPGVIDLNAGNVEIFLDVIEGRYFEQDFSGTKARADRYRARGR